MSVIVHIYFLAIDKNNVSLVFSNTHTHTHTFLCFIGTIYKHNDFFTVQTVYSIPLH